MRKIILGAGLLLLVAMTVPAAQQYQWTYPLEIKAGLSSNFGEFRGDRVHTGIDFRTNMQTGYKVYAIDDGVITRLSVKKLGFGNAVYIEHPNGLMSVYGHLDRFVEEGLGLRSLVATAQKQRKTRYPGDLSLRVPVKRGQLIAFSGETGYGLPHLHLEIRRGGATPINPFLHGFTYQDTSPPVIESLVLQPLGANSSLGGEHFWQEFRTTAQQGGYVIQAIPHVTGKIRVTAAAYDQIGAENRCAVDEIDLYIARSGVDQIDLAVDHKPFFHNQFDQVTYSTNQRGGLVYDYLFTRLSNPSQYYYRLYNLAPTLFPYRNVSAQNNGIWDTATTDAGLHTLTLEVRDVMGNRSAVAMQVSVDKEPMAARVYPPLKQGWQAELRDFQDFVEIVCQTAAPLHTPPTLEIRQAGGSTVTQPLDAQNAQLFKTTYDLHAAHAGMLELTVSAVNQAGEPLQEHWQFPVNPIAAKSGGVVKYGDKAVMSFPAGALYENIFANIFPTTDYEVTPGLLVVDEIYDFRPAGCPLEKKGFVRLQYPASVPDPRKLGIFWWDQLKKHWYFMDDQHDPQRRTLQANIIYPSVYGILADTVTPVIVEMRPAAQSRAKSPDKLTAKITDVGKGVNEGSIVMQLDGKTVFGEFDPDRATYTYLLTKSLPAGKHTLTVQAADRAGNQAVTQTAVFVVQ